MKDQELNAKLTPAARDALDELVQDFRTQTLVNAAESAARETGEVREISVRDILTGVNASRIRRPQRNLWRQALKIYVVLGVLMVIGGLGYLVYRNLNIRSDEPSQVAFITALAGVIASAVASLMLRVIPSRFGLISEDSGRDEPRRTELLSEYLSIWPKIELTARDIVASKLGESQAKKPLSSLFRELQELGVLAPDDQNKLKDLLNKRNKIVHSGEPLGEIELKRAVDEAGKLLSKMRRLSFNAPNIEF